VIEHNKSYERREDMSPVGKLSIIFQPDGDGIIGIWSEDRGYVSVEFCSPGSGGGRSRHTLKALRDLALAMERDNNEYPIE